MTFSSTLSDDRRAVTVRLFAAARDRASAETVVVTLPARARLADLRAALGETIPQLRPLVPHLLFAIGTEYASDDAVVPESSEVIAFPPVSGG